MKIDACPQVPDIPLIRQNKEFAPGCLDIEQLTEKIEKFGQPVAVTIDISQLGDLTPKQISQLIGVRLEKDKQGSIVPVALGGAYDPKTKTFTKTHRKAPGFSRGDIRRNDFWGSIPRKSFNMLYKLIFQPNTPSLNLYFYDTIFL